MGGRRRVALVDLFITARPRIHSTTVGRAGAVPFVYAIGVWKGHPNRESHQLCARDIDANAGWYTYAASQHNPVGNAETDGDADAHINTNANTNTKADGNTDGNTDANTNTSADSNANTGSNANTHSRAANVQPCVRHRDGERGVDQPDR